MLGSGKSPACTGAQLAAPAAGAVAAAMPTEAAAPITTTKAASRARAAAAVVEGDPVQRRRGLCMGEKVTVLPVGSVNARAPPARRGLRAAAHRSDRGVASTGGNGGS